MTTEDVAIRLVHLCRAGKFDEAYRDLYSVDIVSQEPEGAVLGTVRGMQALQDKGQQWHEKVEKVYSSEISDPIVAENFFSCIMKTRVKLKGNPEVVDIDEVCVYRVKEGRVVSEQFFYTPVSQTA